MWSTLTVGVGQPPIQQLDLENGVFLFWSFRENTERQKERPQRGTHKREGRRFGSWPKQTVCSTNVNVAFFSRLRWLESITRCRMKRRERGRDRGGGSEVGETEQEYGRNAGGYLESILTGFWKQILTFCGTEHFNLTKKFNHLKYQWYSVPVSASSMTKDYRVLLKSCPYSCSARVSISSHVVSHWMWRKSLIDANLFWEVWSEVKTHPCELKMFQQG